MEKELIDTLSIITQEEQKILNGMHEVEKDLYTSGQEFTIDSEKMLQAGNLITIRTHTRFINFPLHRHNYVEVIYVLQGSITNIIGQKEVVVQKGELLFLNQFTKHEILPASKEDIAINFIVLPEFFEVAYEMIGSHNVMANFLVNILSTSQEMGEYLHFKVSRVLQIQNLVQNMIYSLIHTEKNYDLKNQTTMGLLFMYLIDSVPYADTREPNHYEKMLIMNVLDYIQHQYKSASLTHLSEVLHLPIHTLSKKIKEQTGYNFKELLQRRRFNKAISLICETNLSVNDIIIAVGYENTSYFHRVFKEKYGMTPRAFRVKNQKKEIVRIS